MVPWIHHIIINTLRPHVCFFTLQSLWRTGSVYLNLFSVSEGGRVFRRYSAVILIRARARTVRGRAAATSSPGPSLLASYYVALLEDEWAAAAAGQNAPYFVY